MANASSGGYPSHLPPLLFDLSVVPLHARSTAGRPLLPLHRRFPSHSRAQFYYVMIVFDALARFYYLFLLIPMSYSAKEICILFQVIIEVTRSVTRTPPPLPLPPAFSQPRPPLRISSTTCELSHIVWDSPLADRGG